MRTSEWSEREKTEFQRLTDSRWWQRAACKGADMSIFFNKKAVEAAQSFCSECHVVTECATAAFLEERDAGSHVYGVRGGIPADVRAERYRKPGN